MLALGSFAAIDLPAIVAVTVVEHHRVDQALTTPFLVSSSGVSDSGSEMGATTRGPVRLDAASVTACGVLSRVDTSYQPTCTGVSAVRDEEGAGSNPATPTGKRQVTPHLVTCGLHYPFPGVRFWEPVGSEHR